MRSSPSGAVRRTRPRRLGRRRARSRAGRASVRRPASVRRAAESVRSSALTMSRPQVDPGTSAIQMPSTSPSDDQRACQSMTGSVRVSRSRSTATKPLGTTLGSNSSSGSCVALARRRCRAGARAGSLFGFGVADAANLGEPAGCAGPRRSARRMARCVGRIVDGARSDDGWLRGRAHRLGRESARRSDQASARRSDRLVGRLRRWLGGTIGERVDLGPVDHVQRARLRVGQAARDGQIAIPDQRMACGPD